MKDFLGQELRIGDNVVSMDLYYGGATRFNQGKITNITAKRIMIDGYAKMPEKVIKIDTILNNM